METSTGVRSARSTIQPVARVARRTLRAAVGRTGGAGGPTAVDAGALLETASAADVKPEANVARDADVCFVAQAVRTLRCGTIGAEAFCRTEQPYVVKIASAVGQALLLNL